MTTPPTPPARATRVVLLLLALAGVALGARFRLAGLLDEVPVWDEWHALRAVKDEGFAELATTLAPADRSIPFTLLFEALSRTVGLDELGLRAPFALAGLATLALVPLAFRRLTGELGAALLAVALALSPLLVFYSRTARPYAPAVLGSLLALAGYGAWREEGSRRALAGFAVATALTLWMMPVYAPFCLAPAGADLLFGALRRDRGRGRRGAVALLAGIAPSALLLLPALGAGGSGIAERVGDGSLPLATVVQSLRVFAGSDRNDLGVAAAAALGAAALMRARDPRAHPLLWAAAAQVGAILALSPRRLEASLVLTRYLLPAAVAVAILAAAAIGRAASGGRRHAVPVASATLAAIGLLALSGPLPGWLAPGPSSFASRRLVERITDPAGARTRERAPLPRAYRPIADSAGAGAILEVPYFVSVPDRIGTHQLHHRRELYLAVTAGVCSRRQTFELPPAGERGFELRRFVALDDLEGLAARGVRWVVVHPEQEARLPHVRAEDRFYDAGRCVRAFARISGRRPRRVGGLAVFDLGAPRRRSGPAARPPRSRQ